MHDAKAASPLLQVIFFFLVWVGCWLPVANLIAIAFNWRPPIAPEQKLPFLGSLYIIALPVLWGAGRVTGMSFSDYGFTWNSLTLNSFGLGFACGVLGLGVLFGIQTALGWVTWQLGDRWRLTMLLTLLLALWIGGTEELIFRGFLVTQLQHDYSLAVAAVISSLIFALLHLVWEQRETLPQLPGLWLMGMVLVLARHIDDGNLGLAWGLHAGWVWAIASLDSAEMIKYTGTGSQWVTGLAGKPLAGAVGIVCLLTTGGILWLFSPV